jgi:hypothetical protein
MRSPLMVPLATARPCAAWARPAMSSWLRDQVAIRFVRAEIKKSNGAGRNRRCVSVLECKQTRSKDWLDDVIHIAKTATDRLGRT